jgi:hypothetical protein
VLQSPKQSSNDGRTMEAKVSFPLPLKSESQKMRYRIDPVSCVTIVLLASGQMVDGAGVSVDDGEDALDVVELVDVGGGSSNDIPEPVSPVAMGS